MSSIIYFFKESLTGFARHLSTTLGSIITLFLSLLIIGAFLFGGTVVNNIVKSVESEVNITAYIADNANSKDVSSLQAKIKEMDGVSSVTYTNKDQALEDFRNSYTSSPEIVDQLGDENPLPASLNIELSEPSKVEQVATSILEDSTFKSVCDNPSNPSDSLKYGKKTVERLFQLTNSIRNVGVVVIILLIFIALVFINNTIRLAVLSRRKEISIMRLVGASNGFIRGPFLMEAILHAIIGTLLAVGCLEVLRNVLLPNFSKQLAWLPMSVSLQTALIVYAGLLVAGLVIVLLGSAFAIRRYLKA